MGESVQGDEGIPLTCPVGRVIQAFACRLQCDQRPCVGGTSARAPRPGGGHHPDFHISSYRVVTVVMSTHSVGALTATGTLACTGLTALAPGSPLLCRPVRAGGLAVATQLGPPPAPQLPVVCSNGTRPEKAESLTPWRCLALRAVSEGKPSPAVDQPRHLTPRAAAGVAFPRAKTNTHAAPVRGVLVSEIRRTRNAREDKGLKCGGHGRINRGKINGVSADRDSFLFFF